MGFFLSPIQWVLGSLGSTLQNLLDSFQMIRVVIDKLKGSFGFVIGDVYGIYGFSGYGRENVEFYTIKDINEKF